MTSLSTHYGLPLLFAAVGVEMRALTLAAADSAAQPRSAVYRDAS